MVALFALILAGPSTAEEQIGGLSTSAAECP